jgi:hypothetical protein
VAEWWNKPHLARSVGAVYSDSGRANYFMNLTAPSSYDALLFVERTTAARGNAPMAATVVDSHEYRDAAAGVAFSLPSGWTMRPPTPFGDQETTVPLIAAQSESAPAFYYKVLASPRNLSAEETRAQLRADCENKVKSRRDAGLTGYRLRPDSFQDRTIGDRPALTCTAEYTQDGREMVEYFVRVYSEKVSSMFFAPLPAAELEQFRPRFDKLVDTLRLSDPRP